MNVEAIFKSQESGRQREGGLYKALGATPAGNVPGATKRVWGQNDYAAANAIDWMVQGSTYGQYESVISTGNNAGLAVTICGSTDIDGDGVIAADAIWQPQIKGDGSLGVNAPDAVCPTSGGAVDYGAHVAAWGGLGVDAPGKVTQLSADSVF
jgi:hypothetical protein